MKKYLFLLIGLVNQSFTKAQDAHFSDYTYSKGLLNPASVSRQTTPYELALQYRNQWNPALGADAYRTFASGVNFKQRQSAYSYNYWGGGVQFYQDQAGSAGFTQNQAHLAGFYSKCLDEGTRAYGLYHYLTLGSSAGFLQNRISDLMFVREFDNTGTYKHDPNKVPMLENNGKMVFDVNVGLLWHAHNKQKQGFEVGFGLFHLNRPNRSWTEQPDPLPMRLTLLASVTHAILNQRALIQYHSSYLRQSLFYQINGGTKVSWQAQAWRLSWGMGFRVTRGLNPFESILSNISLGNNHFAIALNYDFTLGSVRPDNRFNNALEIGILIPFKDEPFEF